MNEVQKSESKDYSKEKAVVETVRNSVFPHATDAELMLYFHKCNTLGVHPLGGMVHPMKFKQKEGEPEKVTFIVSIDLLRSRSSETGQYDGIDEPEFEGEYDQATAENGTLLVPDTCRVKVYRKDVSRPFVGVARWKEFYPGEKKGHQWRQKPYLMLAKCAEAQARRLAFPQELNKLYTDEEMQATTEMLAGIPDRTSTKPRVTPDQVRDTSSGTVNAQAGGNRGMVEDVTVKTGTGKKGAWSRYGVKISGKVYGTFDDKLGKLSQGLNGQEVLFTSENDGKYDNLTSIKPATDSVPEVSGDEEFERTVFMLLMGSGISEKEFTAILDADFSIVGGVKAVPADKQAEILAYLEKRQEQPGA